MEGHSKGEQKKPEYLARQPFGKVPAWEADFKLFESRAICRHACERASGAALVPADAEGRALVDQWASIEYDVFTPAFKPIHFERLLKPAKKLGEPDEAKVSAALKAVGPVLDMMEGHLSGREYLVGSGFTLADLNFMPYFQILAPCKVSSLLDNRPAIAAWWARCSARPAWKYVLAGDFSDHC